METKAYIHLCREASRKSRDQRYEDKMEWRGIPTVRYRETRYIPQDYQFGFRCGVPRHIAILRDMRADSVVQALVADVEPWEKEESE